MMDGYKRPTTGRSDGAGEVMVASRGEARDVGHGRAVGVLWAAAKRMPGGEMETAEAVGGGCARSSLLLMGFMGLWCPWP
jgi:hypothetical protein